MMRAGLLILLAFVAFAPLAGAQGNGFAGHVLMCQKECRPSDVNDQDLNNTPVNVVLYAHISDALQRAPLNAMPPDPVRERDINQGFVTPTVKVREDVLYFDNNWFFFYHLPSMMDQDGGVKNQDGPLSYPLELVGETAKVYWYLSPHALPNHNSSQSPVGGVGALPSLEVYARIDSGRHPLHGTLIAEGRTRSPLVVNLPGGDFAYEFEIPLSIKNHVIPPQEGFVVSINWHQYEAGDAQLTQSDWRIRSGIRFAPRVILPVAEPMRLLETSSLFRFGTHYIATDLSPVLGAYDINPFSLNMTFQSGPTDAGNPTPFFYVYNPLKPQSVKIAWAVPGKGEPLQAGTYTFQFSATNLQSTYRFQEEVHLDIIEFRQNPDTPTVGVTVMLTLLGGAALAAGAAGLLFLARLRNR